MRFSPGIVKSLGMSKRAKQVVDPRLEHRDHVRRHQLDPAVSLLRFSGAVATSAIST